MTVVLFAGLLPLAALANEPTDAATAPPTCKKPLLPSSVRRADDTSEFNDKFSAYQECIKAYVDSQNKLANAHVNAANAAIADANAFVTETNAKLQAK
ncbi:MAG: hypothetical protein NVS9B10_09580 [Nevskia sp.]